MNGVAGEDDDGAGDLETFPQTVSLRAHAMEVTHGLVSLRLHAFQDALGRHASLADARRLGLDHLAPQRRDLLLGLGDGGRGQVCVCVCVEEGVYTKTNTRPDY